MLTREEDQRAVFTDLRDQRGRQYLIVMRATDQVPHANLYVPLCLCKWTWYPFCFAKSRSCCNVCL